MSWVGIRDPGQESVRLLPWIGINYKEGHQFDCATVLSEDNSLVNSVPALYSGSSESLCLWLAYWEQVET